MKYFVLILVLLPWQAGMAEEAGELAYFEEIPVVLSASRLQQPLSEAPNAMTVIDRRMIEASGLRDLTDLFKLVPGMYVGYYKGHQGFVSYHGSPDQYARRMQVMIDGRSVYLPPSSMVDWSSLPITVDDIERIEVIRGPAAASHGANSTQGVISIFTRDAGIERGRRVTVTHGNKGISDVTARFGNSGEDFDYRMTLASTSDYGFDNLVNPPNSIPVTVATAQGLLNNSFDDNRAKLLNYRAEYRPSLSDRLDMQFGFNHDVRNVGWTDSRWNPVHDLITNANFLQLGWTRALQDAGEFRLRYFHIRHDQHETFAVAGIPKPIMQFVNVTRDDIEAQHTLQVSGANRLIYGASARVDRIDGAYSSLMPRDVAYASLLDTLEWRLFAHDEWRITDRLLLNVGGMYERDQIGLRNLSPRVSVSFHATPQNTFRAGASVAYRTPSLMESNGGVFQPGELWVINTIPFARPIQPERLLSREIGYLGELRDWSATVDIRLFSDLLSNGIIGDGRPVNPFVNDLIAEYRGAEATLKYQFSERSNMVLNYAHASASSNGAMLAAAGSRAARSACTWNPDAVSCSISQNSASLLYSHQLSGKWSFGMAMYYQDSMQPFDRGQVDFQPPQRHTDIRLAKAFAAGSGVRGDVALVVQNLFDQQYTDYVANSLNNRRAFVTLGVNW